MASLSVGLLALTVLALWAPPLALGRLRIASWIAGLLLACGAGLAAGMLDWRALAAIALYAALAQGARSAGRPWLRVPLLLLTGLAAFGLALHRWPGFHNIVVASGVQVSRGAPPFTLYANVDTTVAGIVLMGVFCRRIGSAAGWRIMLRRVWPVTLSTLVVVLGLGCALGYVRPDLKWTPWTAAFLAINLLSTCVTEEAFFRGFLLAQLARGMRRWRHGTAAALAVSTLLFGLAHAHGGPPLVLLACVAGLLYGAAYLRARRIEGAILTHFALNAVHFLAFTYPGLGA